MWCPTSLALQICARIAVERYDQPGGTRVELKPGAKLQSAVCEAQFIVVRAPGEARPSWRVEAQRCSRPTPSDPTVSAIDPKLSDGSLLGKRYADEELGLELLCTKAGAGSLTCNGAPLALKGAKPLPASD